MSDTGGDYWTVGFDLGQVVVRTDAGGRTVAVEFDLERRMTPREGRTPLSQALTAYLEGQDEPLDYPIDLALAPPFYRRVWKAAREIPYGSTLSYGQLARAVGSKGAARAVGKAMGANAFPLLVPCHRVIASGGKIGGFSSGIPLKRWLLNLEGITL